MLRLCKLSNSEKTIIKIIKENYSSSSNSRYVRDKNYQFLQNSKVPTMHFQKSMPRLPIPELSKTGERYLKALKPLLSSTQYADAEKRTNNFILKEGKELQAKLIAKDKVNKHTSYISDYWFDLYLRDRVPLPINYNPLIVFQNDSKPAYNDQLVRATNFLVTASRFMLSLRESILEPEVFHMQPKKSDTQLFRTVTGLLPSSLSWYGAYLFKAFPLDMSQFPGLFNATRIPRIDKDIIFRDPSSKHVVVQRKGHFYVFDVLDSNGNLLSPEELLGNMAKIISDDKPSADFPLGILTSQNRNDWAKQRQHLEEIGNAEALKKIDSAIFNLVLDEDSIHEDKHKILRQYLHSDGNNRWFDKSFSLIVTKDGVSGINFEHSWGDGVGVLRFFQDTYKEITNKPFIHPESTASDNHITVEKLSFKIDDKIKECVRNAQMEYKKWCDSLSIDYILYEDLNREDCKKFKVSADCIMQLGFQAAYHLLYGKYVGTYESCSTSAFKHGRTETMRPCTEKTKAFCDQLHSNNYSKDSLRTLMTECSSYHSELVKEAAMGQGFDRHLFALQKMAEENNIQTEIYDSYEYKYLNKSILSTSTLSSPNVLAGGFGPVTREGFGIGYSAFADKLGAASNCNMARKLHYFNVNGLGEPIRYMLHYAGQKFEDVQYDVKKWPIPHVKDFLPYGQLPLYEEGGKTLNQSLAIARYIASQAHLLPADAWEQAEIDAVALNIYDYWSKVVTYIKETDPVKKAAYKKEILEEFINFYFSRFEKELKKNNGFFGNKLSWADFVFVGIVEATNLFLGIEVQKQFPTVQTLFTKVRSLPGVKEYIAKRTPYQV